MQIRTIFTAIPSRPEGRRPSSRTRDGERWTRKLRLTSRGLSVRQRRVVLTSRCWRQVLKKLTLLRGDGGKRAVLRGEHVISRKAIAQGMSDVLRCPVCSCAHSSVHIAHETAGAARIRHSLRPLTSRAKSFQQTSGAMRRENAKAYPRHCERSDLSAEALAKAEAIHVAAKGKNGLLRFARNDDSRSRPLPRTQQKTAEKSPPFRNRSFER